MFKPKKEGRLSRGMGRLICLFWYPAMAIFWLGFILLFVGLFNRPMLDLSSHCLRLCMPPLLIAFVLLLFFPCPHCGRPQIMHRYQRIGTDFPYCSGARIHQATDFGPIPRLTA